MPQVSPLKRDVDQLMSLAAPVGMAAVVAALITSFLAPLTGGVAQSFKLIFAGAVAGIISRTACAPLEMLSTVVMCGKGGDGGIIAGLSKAYNAEGIKGLFKGNGANCLKVAPSRGLQFLAYEFMKRQLVSAGGVLTPATRLLAAGCAGMAATLVVYPLDVVKTLLTLYPDDCRGIGDAFRLVAGRGGGLKGLYRGLGPTLVAMFPYIGIEFMVYETLKQQWELLIGATAGTIALLVLGAISGAASQAAAHPLDVVRRRLQMQGMRKGDAKPAFTNMWNGLWHIGKTEGPATLYKGLAPTCLEKVPSTAIGYYIYEGMKMALKVSSV